MISTIVIGAGRYPKGAKEIGLRGGVEDSLIPSLVLEASIRRYWNDANIINTYEMQKPWMRRHKNPTPFSLVRFMVPALCKFEGWALYCDADQIVFDDVRTMGKSVQQDPGKIAYVGKVGGCTGVILMDTSKLRYWDAWKVADELDQGKSYGQTMNALYNIGHSNMGALGAVWNSFDEYHQGVTKLLHFTNLNTQPWKFPGKHPYEYVWAEALQYAIDVGKIEIEMLDSNCRIILENLRKRRKMASLSEKRST